MMANIDEDPYDVIINVCRVHFNIILLQKNMKKI